MQHFNLDGKLISIGQTDGVWIYKGHQVIGFIRDGWAYALTGEIIGFGASK